MEGVLVGGAAGGGEPLRQCPVTGGGAGDIPGADTGTVRASLRGREAPRGDEVTARVSIEMMLAPTRTTVEQRGPASRGPVGVNSASQ